MNILGLNAFHGDASAALVRDGQLVAALEEERLNRVKHWAGLPVLAAKGLSRGGATGSHRDLPESESASGRQAVAGCAAAAPVGKPQLSRFEQRADCAGGADPSS